MAKLDTRQHLGSGQKRGLTTRCRVCASRKRRTKTSSGGGRNLERRLRSGEMSPALEGHLAKYRKLVPSLALINHLADGGAGPVSQRALLKALAAAYYLESHARRVYGSGHEGELAAAKAILKHIRNGDLTDGFTARDVHQRGWAHLTEREHVGVGLSLLVDHDFVRAEQP